MKNKLITLTAVLLTATITNASAAIAMDVLSDASSATTYDANISSSDLINVGSSSLLSSDYSSGGTFGGTTGAHDGSGAASSNWHYDNSVSGFSFLTFRLDTSYDIASINSIYGYNGSQTAFADQIFDVEISTAANPSLVASDTNTDFSLLYSVNFDPATQVASSQVTLTDSSGTLASGVTAIRFKMFTNPSNNQVGIVREIDVVAVPEPSAFGLLAGVFGFTWVMLRRRA